jgi:hypothetical protein
MAKIKKVLGFSALAIATPCASLLATSCSNNDLEKITISVKNVGDKTATLLEGNSLYQDAQYDKSLILNSHAKMNFEFKKIPSSAFVMRKIDNYSCEIIIKHNIPLSGTEKLSILLIDEKNNYNTKEFYIYPSTSVTIVGGDPEFIYNGTEINFFRLSYHIYDSTGKIINAQISFTSIAID